MQNGGWCRRGLCSTSSSGTFHPVALSCSRISSITAFCCWSGSRGGGERQCQHVIGGIFFFLFKGSSLKVVCFTNCGPELNYIIPSSCKGGWEMQFNCGSRRKGKGVWWIHWQSIPMGALYSTYPLVSCLLAFFYLPLLTQTTYLHGFYDMEDSCLVLFL